MDRTKRQMLERKAEEKKLARNGLYFAFSLLAGLCGLASGVYPFALALLLSSTPARGMTAVFLGCFAAGLFTGAEHYVMLPVCMAVFALQWLWARKGKKRPLLLKVLLAVAAAIILGITEALAHNIVFESLTAGLTVFAAVPVFTVLYEGWFADSGEHLPLRRNAAAVALAFTLCRALMPLTLGGISLGAIAGAVITLYFAKHSAYLGTVVGFLAGLGAGLTWIPVLGILGLCFGVFYEYGKPFAYAFSLMLSFAVGAYAFGTAYLFPASVNPLVGMLLFAPMDKKFDLKLPALLRREENSAQGALAVRMATLGSAFSSLGKVFYTVNGAAEKSRSSATEKKINEKVFRLCDGCRGCTYDRYDLINHLTDACRTRRLVLEEDLPKSVAASCRHKGELLYTVNTSYAEAELERAGGIRGMAEEYMAFSRLLGNESLRAEEELFTDPARTRRVRAMLAGEGIACTAVRITGKRRLRVQISGVQPEEMHLTPRALSQKLSGLLGGKFSTPEFCASPLGNELIVHSVPLYRVESAKLSLTKEGESVCGDTASFFESDSGCFHAVICDGMGSGGDAALTSRLAGIYLEKLLSVGGDRCDVLEMLNKLLLQKEEEIFTTVDLFRFDRYTGDAWMVKAGAASSFIYHGETCRRIEAATPPVGVMEKLDAVQTHLKLARGDVVVMFSDGIRLHGENPVLEKKDGLAVSALASVLAEKLGGCVRTDDVSVCVMRIV